MPEPIQPDLLQLFVAPLQKASLNYFISGSVAANFYGEPRSTLDVDIAIALNRGQLDAFPALYPESEFYVPPPEVLEIECGRPARGHFNILHPASGLKADFYPSRNHPFFGWAMENVREVRIGDLAIRLAPPEYVILWKLESYREARQDKHLRDIRSMLREQGGLLDFELLSEAVAVTGLGGLWTGMLDS